ncbi:MAG: lipopolysaccharide export system protein LptA [Psychrosphaera sp.]|jgi:lipopolysaccharide export system protein LptA|uniref:lipopolysaccharide transport periplasmic protein LptA n=1 Tax=Psychrosphaera sp. F3M07 TaxID=2841560 RepID=UPI001C08BD7F|nr:lipopolysaccharide transport periplasmic protein LptA [Psychrosphaera sp. F3M07]MBU2919198.1 lipopolysaccharide transport periplasmic protein LptA [Psychrosphaera sp. F3M07]
MYINKIITGFCSMLLLFSSIVSASEDLIIDADNQDLDYKNNTLYFSGNVVVKQGSVTIKADELFVITKEGNSDKLIAKGTPAIFSQKEQNNQELSAQALEITYLVEAQVLQLAGSAKFQQGGSVVESAKIEFDLKAQRVKAEGDESQNGRVTTRLKTKKD